MRAIKIFLLWCLVMACSKHTPPVIMIPVTDGMIYYDTMTARRDSLKLFAVGLDTFLVTMKFEKLSTGYPLPDAVTEIDNALDEYLTIKYTPQNFAGDNIVNPLGWNFAKNQISNVSHHKNTLSFIQTDGWIDYSFTGYKIEYYAERFESYGIAGVSIDSGPEVMVDLYAPVNYNNSTMVFVADSLKEGDNAGHTIRIRYTKQRNPNSNSTNARINMDKLVTYMSQGVMYKQGVVDKQGRVIDRTHGLDKPNKRAVSQYEQK